MLQSFHLVLNNLKNSERDSCSDRKDDGEHGQLGSSPTSATYS